MKKKRNSNPSQYIGLALNFGIILVISMVIMFKVGAWIDAKLGTRGIFTLIFVIMGIVSGFRVLMSNIEAIDRHNKYRYGEDDDDEWIAINNISLIKKANKKHKI